MTVTKLKFVTSKALLQWNNDDKLFCNKNMTLYSLMCNKISDNIYKDLIFCFLKHSLHIIQQINSSLLTNVPADAIA